MQANLTIGLVFFLNYIFGKGEKLKLGKNKKVKDCIVLSLRNTISAVHGLLTYDQDIGKDGWIIYVVWGLHYTVFFVCNYTYSV